MNTRTILLTLIVAACCLLSVQPIHAQSSEDQTTIYETSFTSDPHWITNTGGASSSYYWVPDMGIYHFSIEPSSGGYTYIPVEFDSGSFTLDYDFLLTRIDEGATFRMGYPVLRWILTRVPMSSRCSPMTQNTARSCGFTWCHLETSLWK